MSRIITYSLLAWCLAAFLRAEETGLHLLPGSAGAITVPFEMPVDGIATVGLYHPDGHLVRTIAQLERLPAGRHGVRWDGMDAFGRLVPAGSDLEVRVIANPGIRAFYEMAVDQHGGRTPWPTAAVGEGEARRAGGWLGDHGAPSIACAVGNRVFLGASLAEFGSNLIMCTLDGEKMTGRNLDGWSGPLHAATDGEAVWADVRTGRIARIDPTTFQVDWITAARNGPVLALAARPGEVLVSTRNAKKARSPFRCGPIDPDCFNSIPEVHNTKAPTEFHLGGFAAYKMVFTGGGRPEVGAGMAVNDVFAYRIAVFKQPVELGSLLVERCGPRLEVHCLREGLTFDPEVHRLDKFLPEELPEGWVKFGETGFPRRVVVMTAPERTIRTSAICFRVYPGEALQKNNQQGLQDVWEGHKIPGLVLARILTRRMDPVTTAPRMVLPDGRSDLPDEERMSRPTGPAVSWDFHARYDISALRPAHVILDYGAPIACDGLMFLGCCNPRIAVQHWIGPTHLSPDNASDEHWETIGSVGTPSSKKLRSYSAITRGHERYVHFKGGVTARYFRVRLESGRLQGKSGSGMIPDDARRTCCAEVLPLRLRDHIPEEDDRDNTQILEVHGITLSDPDDRGRRAATVTVREVVAGGDIAAMACDGAGTLFGIVDCRLCRIDIAGEEAVATVLGDTVFNDPLSLAVDDQRIAVGDRQDGVLLFGHDGSPRGRFGDGPRRPGAWNGRWVHKPSSISLDANGKLWMAENALNPKRVARYALDGSCEWEAFGPPMYGGGGHLDPDLKSFYYRGAEYALDWQAGTSRLKAMNDTQDNPTSPLLETNSFGWTDVSQVRYHNGVRYLVGGGGGIVITIKGDADAWRPAAVLAPAIGSGFLLGKACWNEHWSQQALQGRSFIWCDRNDDGDYQVDEVELYETETFGGIGGAVLPDLTIQGGNRLRPSGFTPGGVPLYEAKHIECIPWAAAETYGRMMSLGGKDSAKPCVGFSCVVTAAGIRYREGQPYAWTADGSLLGGGLPEMTNSDFVPPIYGRRMDQPMQFVGSAMTASEVGEVAVMNGNSGIWYLISPEHCAVIGEVFTGRDGGWSTGLEDVRGTEVTGRKFRHETFFGDFVKAHDGRYYATGGKGFHAISRLEGLDDFKLLRSRITVPEESVVLNTELRAWLKSRPENDGRVIESHVVEAKRLDVATDHAVFDGDLRDWGGIKRMITLGPMRHENFFTCAWDDESFTIAWSGWAHLGNAAEDFQRIFTTGFGLDFKYNAGRDDPRRVVFAPLHGEWTGVMFQYHDDDVMDEDLVEYASPLGVTKVARVYRLTAEECQIRFMRHELGIDLSSVDEMRDRVVTKGLKGALANLVEEEEYRVDHGSEEHFTAEIRIRWQALGFPAGPPSGLSADFGILSADSGGTTVDRRTQWANKKTDHCSDVGIEAQINPRAWGKVTLSGKR